MRVLACRRARHRPGRPGWRAASGPKRACACDAGSGQSIHGPQLERGLGPLRSASSPGTPPSPNGQVDKPPLTPEYQALTSGA